MQRRQIPIGLQTFRTIREEGCCYADKYRDRGKPIHLVAAAFGGGRRNLVALRAEGLAPSPPDKHSLD